jgi:glyoxylase-like metal-dependent hydrolase (beta-lactamase superfamily II)
MKLITSIAALAMLAVPLSAHDIPATPAPLPIPKLLEAFDWNAEKTEVKTEKLEDGFYVLFGLGGNIAMSSGKDGVLIVDDQLPEVMPKLKRAMRKQGVKEIDFAINTHWHFDHAEGNKVLGKEGTWLISHSNSREMMMKDNVINLVSAAGLQEAYPSSALPHITFDEHMQFYLNGERIDLIHFGPAHTTGDAVVFFRGRNAVHMGDIYNNAGYPFVDADNGGTLDGMLHTCKAVLEAIDVDTVVIPGHGPLANQIDLQNYVYMLEIVYGELKAMIAEGKSLDEIHAAGVTSDWDDQLGDPTMFINRSYASLTSRYHE